MGNMGKLDLENSWQGNLIRALVIALSSFIVAMNLNSFVRAGDLFPGGFTGLTRLIIRAGEQYFSVAIPFAPINLLLNAIPAAISFKFSGKKFTLYSCLAIVLTSVFTDLVPAVDITEDVLLVCVFGGIINGFAIGICLWVRATSGGTDFISIALSERKNVDAWNYILCGNVVMLMVAGAMFGWDRALYSIIFQFASTQTIRLVDPDARRSTLLIVAPKGHVEDICALIRATHHSATLLDGTGMYDGEPRTMIYTVVENSAVRALSHQVRQVDPKVFVNVLRTEKVAGKFYRRPRD